MKKTILFLVMAVALTTQTLFAQVPSYVPTNGLVGYWPFNGNANDQSGNGNNGTVNGATLTADRFGNANSAFGLATLTENLSVNNVVPSFNNNALSVSLWMKFPTQYNQSSLALVKNGIPYTNGFDVAIDQNNAVYGLNNYLVVFLVGNGVSVSFISNQSELGAWSNIVSTYDGSNIKIYLNGILKATQSFNQSLNIPNNNLVFGSWDNPTTPAVSSRQIDDIGMWNRALTQQEITNLYNSSLPQTACLPANVPTTGLVGYWPFCGNANDESGNGNNGTNNGAALTADRFGNANSAYSFNGQGENIKVPSINNSTFENDFSISLWCKNSNFLNDYGHLVYGQNQFIVLNNNGPAYNSSLAKISGYQGPYDNPSLRRTPYLETNSQLNINTNYHVVYTKSNNIAYIYINGVLENSISTNNTLALPSGSFIEFGSGFIETANYSFNGTLDDIGIWNRALSQQEITNLYNANQCITNITVTDTLIINVGQLSFNDPVTWANNITIAPNPASTQININFNNITNLNGGTLKIINSLGQEVATTPITTSGTNSTMQLATWGGTGMYFVQIINPQGQIVDIKKIILQ
jgi:hypothetical protein